MAASQFTTHPDCSLGYTRNHSCWQCLKHTLEAWGYDAEAYRTCAVREWHRRFSKEYRQYWYRQTENKIADKKRLKQYGLTPEEYADLVEVQGGVCALCGQAEKARRGDTAIVLSVDHDHTTGKVRGLLCRGCNTMLGLIEKRGAEWLHRADAYVKRST